MASRTPPSEVWPNTMNRRQRALLARTLLFLFALNAVFLTLYILLHPRPTTPSQTLVSDSVDSRDGASPLKPWPSLPSFLPWSLTPSPPPGSCEAYFGHGFSLRLDPLRPSPSGWFRCFYSETLKSSVCEAARLRMDPARIRMARGGEQIESVIGRREEDEMPKFEAGAFQIDGGEGVVNRRKVVDVEFLDRYVPQGGIHPHAMRELVGSISLVDSGELKCSEWLDEPTILVTRYEYANLFHTITDWYSAYVSSRVARLPARPHVIFVDGHCKAPMEETWEALFSSIRYAKNFSGPLCFRHAILSPLGYETALFKGLSETVNCHGTSAHILQENPDERKTARLSEFGEFLRAAFGLSLDQEAQSNSSIVHNLLFVRREDYLAHPRHSGIVQSRLSNEQEVFDSVKSWAANHSKCNLNVINGLFAHMSMKEQIRAIQEASVVIGAHGAGLTHLVAATAGTVILEIISSTYRRPHFALISQWKGLEYHAINLSGSYAQPSMVIDELSSIVGSLGC